MFHITPNNANFPDMYNIHLQQLIKKELDEYILNLEVSLNFKFKKIHFYQPSLNEDTNTFDFTEVLDVIVTHEGIDYKLSSGYYLALHSLERIKPYYYNDTKYISKIVTNDNDDAIALSQIPKNLLADRLFHIKYHLLRINLFYWLIYYNKNEYLLNLL